MHPILQLYNNFNNFGNSMGMKLEVVAAGEIIYEMPVQKMHLSNPLAAHGGAVAALMDGVLGVSALSLAVEKNMLVSTVEFKLNYFRPVVEGDVLTGFGKVVFEGKSLINTSGEIKNQKGELVCTGTGTFNKYPVKNNVNLAGATLKKV